LYLQGIQKWETTVTEALIKLRDFSERRYAPALQRLHLVLDELVGWANLLVFSSFLRDPLFDPTSRPQFAPFQLPRDDLTFCTELASRGIILASWLAAECRRELFRFKEFIAWLRFGALARHTQKRETDQMF